MPDDSVEKLSVHSASPYRESIRGLPRGDVTDSQPVIEAKKLKKRWDSNVAGLIQLDFLVRPGQIYCLLGGSGTGKTTAVRLLMGQLRPDEGEAVISGFDAGTSPRGVKKNTTFVLADQPLYLELTPRQNLEFFVRMAGSKPSSGAIDNALRWSGIAERDFGRVISVLSRATVVLTWLAIAIARDTPAVVVDEPTRNMTADETSEIRSTLLELRRRDKAILVASADIGFALGVSDRLGILVPGQPLVERRPADVRDQRLSDFYQTEDREGLFQV